MECNTIKPNNCYTSVFCIFLFHLIFYKLNKVIFFGFLGCVFSDQNLQVAHATLLLLLPLSLYILVQFLGTLYPYYHIYNHILDTLPNIDMQEILYPYWDVNRLPERVPEAQGNSSRKSFIFDHLS